MNGKPIPLPLRLAHEPGSTPPLVAVESVIGYLNLPTARPPIEREDGVHIVVRDGDAFARWFYNLGGEVEHTEYLDGAVLYCLRTRTPARVDGSSVELHVHVALVADEFAPAEFRGAGAA
ncbi:hypothetical protein ACWC4J_06595 [Streptomyces sp. NPDC001356]